MSKELIHGKRYVYNINANGSIFIIFDYFTNDFKVNETQYFNFYFLDKESLLSNKKTIFYYFYNKTHYSFLFYSSLLFKKYILYNQTHLLFLSSEVYIYSNYYVLEQIKFFYKKCISNIFYNF